MRTAMRLLATLMLMVALVTMTVQTASADISRPPCPSQMRADNMCYATALPAGAVEGAKKAGGVCCDLFPAMMTADEGLPRGDHWMVAIMGRSPVFTDRYLWRPPRA